jgi:type I restriction enzyme S subunit
VSNSLFIEKLLNGAEVEWIPLKKLGTWYGGGTPSKTRDDFWENGTIPWVSPKDMGRPIVDSSEDYITEAAIDGSSTRLVPANSVAIVVRSSILDKKLPTAFIPVPVTLNQDMKAVIPHENINTRYVAHLITSRGDDILRAARKTGGSVASIDSSKLYSFLIPIPCPSDPKRSMEIQGEIVRILDTFTELTTELTAELTARKKQYNYYRDKLLTFEEGETEWKTLGEVCDFKNGFAFKSNLFKDYGLPIVRITNVNGTTVDLTDVKYFNPDDYKENTQSYIINRGDILIAMSGATTGKIGYFNSTEVAYLNQRVGKFVPNTELLNNRFLYHFLLSKTEAIYVLAGGGAQPNLSSKVLMEKLRVPIPHADDPAKSIAEQKKIADVLDKLDMLTNSITEGLPREIELRQKQYEYYRDLLLSFPKPDGIAIGSNDE